MAKRGSKWIVRAVTNGTKVDLAVNARTWELAIEKAKKDRSGRYAAAFIVYDRVTGWVAGTGKQWVRHPAL